MKDFSKAPTDTQIIKAFKEFEHAYNVFDALLRLAPDRAYPTNLQAVANGRDDLYRAHRLTHELTRRAEERKEAAKK